MSPFDDHPSLAVGAVGQEARAPTRNNDNTLKPNDTAIQVTTRVGGGIQRLYLGIGDASVLIDAIRDATQQGGLSRTLRSVECSYPTKPPTDTTCIQCDQQLSDSRNAIRLQQHGQSTIDAYCHADCADEFIRTLQAIWEHTDTILADAI